MPEESFEEKTEKPTPRKREEARKKGEVARSKELPSVAVLLSALFALGIFGSYIYGHLQTIMVKASSAIVLRDLDLQLLLEFSRKIIILFILMLSPLFTAIVVTAVFSNIMQVGFMLSGESIRPRFSKLDPVKGLKRLFSMRSVMELFISLAKLIIVGSVAYLTVKGEMQNVVSLGGMATSSIVSYIFGAMFKLFVRCSLAMIIIIIIDYSYQRWEFEKRMKMTKREMKEDLKRTEGDPFVKSRIRSIQMQMARKRMMQAVPEADVVITNPSHIAVALKYDGAVMGAPKLMAKGKRRIAEKIKEIAREHDIPVLENKPLARSLYDLVEVGQEIPPTLYQAVAEILAYIYKLKPRTV